jgi:nicotinamidase/pyrazinamidase
MLEIQNCCLVVVDVQYDFMPGGSLAVPQGDKVVDIIKSIRDAFRVVVFTQDWHPKNHCSFKKNGGIWPVHCAQNTSGAEIDRALLRKGDTVVKKGQDPAVDSYSGFWDNNHSRPAWSFKTELDDFLKDKKILTVYLAGLATDYCVKFTALDAVDAGYSVFLVADACQGVEVQSGDVARALEEMKQKGVKIINSTELK